MKIISGCQACEFYTISSLNVISNVKNNSPLSFHLHTSTHSCHQHNHSATITYCPVGCHCTTCTMPFQHTQYCQYSSEYITADRTSVCSQ